MSLRTLRRHVRRNKDLTRGARLFFEDVCDMHDGQGCYAGDEWLAVQHGTTARTIRSWRAELRTAGVLDEEKRDGKRFLIPVEEDESGSKLPKSASETPESGSKLPKSTSGAEANFRKNTSDTERYNIPPTGESVCGEGAPARASPAESESNQITFDPVKHIEENWSVQVGGLQADEIRQTVTDEARWRQIVKRFRRQGDTQRRKVAWALDDYENPKPSDGKRNPETTERDSTPAGVPAGREGGQWGEYAERRA